MNDQDLDGFEADLRRLQPAAPPPAFMARLADAVESFAAESPNLVACGEDSRGARPAESARSQQIASDARTRQSALRWSPLLRWLTPAAAVAGVVIFTMMRSTIAPKAPVVPAATPVPLKADDVQIARRFVGTFDALAELPGGETVRFRCQEWAEQMTWRDTARGIEVVQSTPSFEVVPIRFETY